MVAAADFWPEFMRNEAQNATCRYLATRGGAALGRWGGGVAGGFFGGPGGAAGGGAAGSWLGGAGGAALGAAWCPDGDPGGGEFPLVPPAGFPTGWCDGVVYGGSLEYTRNDGPIQIAGTGALWGPVTGIRIIPNGVGTTIGALCRGFGFGPIQPPGTFVPMVDAPSEVYTEARFLSLSRLDGLPDCPPPNSGPIIPGPGDIPDIDIDPIAITPINVDIDFGPGGIVNVNGDLRLIGPVIVGGALGLGFNFDGLDFNLFPNGEINIGGGRDLPPAGDPPLPPGNDSARQLEGVVYRVTNTADSQSFDEVNNGRFYYPRFGALRFEGKGVVSEQFAMNGQAGYIPNPEPAIFVGYRFTPYKPSNTADFVEVTTSICCQPNTKIGR